MTDFLGQFTVQQLITGSLVVGFVVGLFVGGAVAFVTLVREIERRMDR